MSKLRVAMLITAYYPILGGAERQLGILAPRLQAQDIDVHILTRHRPGLAHYEEIGGVPVHRLFSPPSKVMASAGFTVAAIRKIQQLKPDVIHTHSLLSPATTGLIARYLFKTPVVSKVLRGGIRGDLDVVQSRALGRWRLPYLMRHINGFIVISQEIDQELADLGVPPERRHFVPNGVDVDRFHPVAPEEKQQLRKQLNLEDVPTGLYMGRLIPEKRVDQLVNIWQQIRSQHPSANLLILGSGSQEEKIRADAGPGVHILGAKDDVVPYLQAADFFVLPSATEGLSNAMLEAMSAGLPAVVTRVGGAPDLIEQGKQGWLVTPDNTAELTDTIHYVLKNPEEAAQVGLEARKRVVDDYALDAIAKRLRTIYDTLSDGNNRKVDLA